MPELPEVEVTRMGLAPHVVGHTIQDAVFRVPRLRSLTTGLAEHLRGCRVESLSRRGKYLIWRCERKGEKPGYLVTHLGMSGYWRLWPLPAPEAGPHDHVDLVFDDFLVRLNDVRRFGDMRWFESDPFAAAPLSTLGMEPFDESLTPEVFAARLRRHRSPVKEVLMAGRVVVGCGNIYASEALFAAGIHPARRADRISNERCAALLKAIRWVLASAIEAGGSTLRDFHGVDGVDGYFALSAAVYGREGKSCVRCGAPIRRIVQAGRSTYYCPHCQK